MRTITVRDLRQRWPEAEAALEIEHEILPLPSRSSHPPILRSEPILTDPEATLGGWSTFVGLQIEYSLIERAVERELIPMAQALRLGVTAWSRLSGGFSLASITVTAQRKEAA